MEALEEHEDEAGDEEEVEEDRLHPANLEERSQMLTILSAARKVLEVLNIKSSAWRGPDRRKLLRT